MPAFLWYHVMFGVNARLDLVMIMPTCVPAILLMSPHLVFYVLIVDVYHFLTGYTHHIVLF